ncbi:MAG: hypothetical protein CM15mP79_2720 [Methanobacteriota archaeon]|nr:MAG: hypothetical protein CM15mP79_2720 [Euryarchaeota archaeon]
MTQGARSSRGRCASPWVGPPSRTPTDPLVGRGPRKSRPTTRPGPHRPLSETLAASSFPAPPGLGKNHRPKPSRPPRPQRRCVVKTMEGPRDLQLADRITQYAPLEGDLEKTAEIFPRSPRLRHLREVRRARDFGLRRRPSCRRWSSGGDPALPLEPSRLIGKVELGGQPGARHHHPVEQGKSHGARNEDDREKSLRDAGGIWGARSSKLHLPRRRGKDVRLRSRNRRGAPGRTAGS